MRGVSGMGWGGAVRAAVADLASFVPGKFVNPVSEFTMRLETNPGTPCA